METLLAEYTRLCEWDPHERPLTPERKRHAAEFAAKAEAAELAGDFEEVSTLLGRVHGPYLLALWLNYGLLTTEQLREHLLHVWRAAELPGRALTRHEWATIFARAGFLSDTGRPAPTAAVELWRAQSGRWPGFSWTEDRNVALWFQMFRHRRYGTRVPPPRLLHGFVAPRYVLALIDDEREVIVHPKYIKLVPAAPATPHEVEKLKACFEANQGYSEFIAAMDAEKPHATNGGAT
jgi:hypothetical protein